jgi:hypothetical protein
MRRIFKNLWVALLAISLVCVVLYFLYLLTIDLMLDASKDVYIFALFPAAIAIYFLNKQDVGKDRESLRKTAGLIGILIAFVALYLICSWATAFVLDLFSGTGSSCVGEACDEMRDGWIP